MKNYKIKNGDTAEFTVNGKAIKIGVKEFTPEEARETIKKSDEKFTNRRTRQSIVRQYSKDMQEGKWETNGDMLRFNKEGTLIDGKHRLSAFLEQDKPIEFLTAMGIDINSVYSIDIGAKRSLENSLQLMCDSYETGSAPIVRAKMVLDKKGLHRGQSESNAGTTRKDQVDEYEKYRDEYNQAAKYGRRISQETGKALNVSEVGALYLHLRLTLGWDRDFVEDFFSRFGSVSRAENNIYNTTLNNLSQKKSCKGADRTKELIMCWNSHVKGRNSNRVPYKDGDWFEEAYTKE